MRKWTKQEDNILINKYLNTNIKNISAELNRSIFSVKSHMARLGLKKIWSRTEIRILKKFYPQEGCLVQNRLPNRTNEAIRIKAGLLKIKNTNKQSLQKEILRDIGNNKIIANCINHGDTIFYYYKHNKRSKCLKCHRETFYRYRKSLLGNYKCRIQSSLKSYTRGIAHFSKHLPYNAQELMDHLENIRKNQNNCCPMCNISYIINPDDIDHIIPVSNAKTIKEIIKLYDLNNLTLLCFKCNRFIKRNRMVK